MRKILLYAAMFVSSVLFFESCGPKAMKEIIEIDNALTQEEIAAGILTPEVMWKLGRVGNAVLSPDGQKVVYTITNYNMKQNVGVTTLYMTNLNDKTTVELTDNAGNDTDPAWSTDGETIYFMSDRTGSNQLWKMSSHTQRLIQISEIEDGIETAKVSPSADKVMYIKRVQVVAKNSAEIYTDMDKSKAKIYDDLMARHWNYWDDGSYLHIFVADLSGDQVGEGKDIMKNEAWDAPTAPYFDASEIAWNNTGTALAYTCRKLTGKDYAVSTNTDIYLYDVASSSTRNLTEGMMGYDKYPRFSPDDKTIAFTSMERPGNEADKNRLFLVDIATGAKTYLTPEFEHNAENVVWNGNDNLYFASPIQGTHQICSVDKDTQVKVLTSGDHDINAFTFAGDAIIAEMVSISHPAELYTVDSKTGVLEQLTTVNNHILDKLTMGKVEKRWIKTTDGKQMLTWVILPPNFDQNKQYPALLYCQGGPQSVVSQFWSYRWNFQLMAAQGYVVVAPNRRGTPSFGQQWLDQISGDYSGQNIQDYLSAIDEVSTETWVDREHLGCVGASYGGYSVYYLAGHHQNRFKAFISHCGMFNLESMFGSTEELWFPTNDMGGTYWSTDPVAKRSYANSPHRFVQNWNTPIMIIVGLNDFRIPYAESLQAFTAARMMGVPARLVAFENEAHQVFKPQNSMVWNREFFSWLDKYLKPAPEK